MTRDEFLRSLDRLNTWRRRGQRAPHKPLLLLLALGLTSDYRGFKVLISSEVHGQSSALHWLRDFHDQPLRPAQSNESEPWPKFVNWHAHEVFRKPALR